MGGGFDFNRNLHKRRTCTGPTMQRRAGKATVVQETGGLPLTWK